MIRFFFEVTIPVTSGTSPKPVTTAFVPFTSSPYATYPSNGSLDPAESAGALPFSPVSRISWVTYLLLIVATVCIIIVPLVIVMYHNKRQQHKRKTRPSSNNSSNAQFTESCEVQR